MDSKISEDQMENVARTHADAFLQTFGIQGDLGNPTNPACKPETVEKVIQTMKSFMELQMAHDARSGSQRTIYEEFSIFEPPTFSGTDNPFEAENWLCKIESIFKRLEVTDEHKVALATAMLKDDARLWWVMIRARRMVTGTYTDVSELAKVTWKQFVDVFNDKYIPLSFKFEMEQEFFCLKQGEMSVAEYEDQFIALSRFVPDLVCSEDACKRFEQGLKLSIRSRLALFEITKYSDVVNKAKLVEHDLNEGRREQFKKAKFDITATQRSEIGNTSQSTYTWSSVIEPIDSQPNNPNGEIVCYKCRLTGHIAKDCSTDLSSQPDTCNGEIVSQICGVTGHIVRDCPQGLSSQPDTPKGEIVCHRCGLTGHIARDCPRGLSSQSDTPKGEIVCHRCGLTGHIARECLQGLSSQIDTPKGEIVCHRCGLTGHIAGDCMLGLSSQPDTPKGEIVCHRCGLTGHIGRDCLRGLSSQPNTSKGEIVCYKCGLTGHIARDCLVGRSSQPDTTKGEIVCHRCRLTGHIARDCLAGQSSQPDMSKGAIVRHKCGLTGHIARDCLPGRTEIVCQKCGLTGHKARRCKRHKFGTCFRCGQIGHKSQDCTATYAPSL